VTARTVQLAGAVLAAGVSLAGCTTGVAGQASPAGGGSGPGTPESTRVADYAAGQQHVTTAVDYSESPPVGGPHAPTWADCTGTVYDVDVRHENAVHSLEHGAVWVTYDPDLATEDDVAALTELVEGIPYRMLSPYEELGSPVAIQAWNNQLTADSADDPRLAAFADRLTQDPDNTPEPGATCQNDAFRADPETA
jgi:hypothetical protein